MKFLVPLHLLGPQPQPKTPYWPLVNIDPAQKVIKAREVVAMYEVTKIIQLAEEEGRRIKGQAQREFLAERTRGYRDGLQAAKLEQSTHMIEQVGRAVDYFESVEKRMVDLVMSSVRKIIFDFRDCDLVVSVVKSALSAVRSQKQITVRVHAEQVEAVQSSVNAMIADFPSITFLDVVADKRVQPNGCIVESEIGLVEVSLDEQLEALHEAFNRVLMRKRSGTMIEKTP